MTDISISSTFHFLNFISSCLRQSCLLLTVYRDCLSILILTLSLSSHPLLNFKCYNNHPLPPSFNLIRVTTMLHSILRHAYPASHKSSRAECHSHTQPCRLCIYGQTYDRPPDGKLTQDKQFHTTITHIAEPRLVT